VATNRRGLRQAEHLADHDRPGDDRGHLGMPTDEEGADLGERASHRCEEVADD